MVILNTTYSVEAASQEQWLNWLQTDFYAFLEKTEMVQKKLLTRIIGGQQGGNFSYSLQLYMEGAVVYQEYEKTYLPQAEALLISKFGTSVLSFSTLLKVVE